jgi:hypothetical protein
LEAARYAAYRGGDQRIGEIAFRIAHANFSRLHGSARDSAVGYRIVIFTLADGLRGQQVVQALFLALGLDRAGLLFSQLGLCLS